MNDEKTITMRFILTLLVITMASCGNLQNNDSYEASKQEEKVMENAPTSESRIRLLRMNHSPLPKECGLKLTEPERNARLNSGEVEFVYEIEGFELQKQSELADTIDIVSSEKGQHIHAILNNQPYMAHYQPGFKKELTPGRYVLLSFLSRSHHESIKTESASDLMQFTVGDDESPEIDLDQPHLFYSRPKGTYDIMAHKEILLDFYVVNCKLSESGYSVRATIDQQEFRISEWTPYIIRGMEEGVHTITLELLDDQGNTVPSPFNPVSREIELTSDGKS
jgi:hypothetical protein